MSRTVLCPLVLLVVVGGWVHPASAATVTISYQITGGTVTTAVSAFPITGGSFRTRLQALGSQTVLSGPATLLSLALSASGLTGYGNFFDVLSVSLPQLLEGSGTAGSGFVNGSAASLAGNLNLHCLTYCTPYPLVQSVPQTFSAVARVPVGGIAIQGPNGTAVGSFSVPALASTGTFLASFTGQEVGRQFNDTPEPRGLLLVALGAAVAAAAGWARIRRAETGRDAPDGAPRSHDRKRLG